MAVVISFNASNRFEKEFWDCVSKVLIPLPQDIQEEITIMIAHYEHSQKFTNLTKEICFLGTKSRVQKILNIYNYEEHRCLPNLIKDIVNDQDYIISILKTCRCCKRHRQKHPSSTTNWNGTPYFGQINSMPLGINNCWGGCQCYCRHISRHMARSVTPTNLW